MKTIEMKKPIEFAVIQSGYAVFGVGETEQDALEDAASNMEDEFGRVGGMNANEVGGLLEPLFNHVDGDFILMESDHDHFDSYMENQGGFVSVEGTWFKE